jgi:7-cyano-7-deazaguanine tRNA-ribosyltransferase
VLYFKPPFGPYPIELKETFPIGPAEIPPWNAAMVRQGCRGIRMLAESHKESKIMVAGLSNWNEIFCEEVGNTAELIE